MQLWNNVYWTFVCGCLWISLNLMMRKWSSCVIIIGAKQKHSKVIIGNVDVTPVSVGHGLTLIWIFRNNSTKHANMSFSTCTICSVFEYILSQESACTLVHAFIIGCIDFLNPLFTFVNCHACSCTAYN